MAVVIIIKDTRCSAECWDHCDKTKTVKSNIPSINYPYFANFFKFFVVKLKFFRKSSAQWPFASGCDYYFAVKIDEKQQILLCPNC